MSEDDESEGGDGTKSSDGPLSMSETRKEMQKRMEKKVDYGGAIQHISYHA